jgi:hypothetical protein
MTEKPMTESTTTALASDRHDRWFWLGAGGGLAFIVAGVRGLLHDRAATQPSDLVKWLLGAGIVHDAVIAPIAVLAAWITRRAVPAPARSPIRLGLAATALLVVLTWPLVQGWGRRTTNPSALPLDYGRNLLATLVVLWTVVIVVAVVRLRGARR